MRLKTLPILLCIPLSLVAQPRYTGSVVCERCHSEVYQRWKKTRMANVVVDPKEHPEAIIPDLSKPDPLVTFKKEDIAFVYGSKWKQRYFRRVGDDYFPLPAQWDIKNGVWRARTRFKTARIGGPSFVPATILRGPRDRFATDAIR